MLDLQAAVIGGESEFGRLESQLLCLQTHLAHVKETEVCMHAARGILRFKAFCFMASDDQVLSCAHV